VATTFSAASVISILFIFLRYKKRLEELQPFHISNY